LNVLSLRSELLTSTQWMSDDMAINNRFSHIDSLGRDPATRMTAFGYTFDTNKGENIAAGYSSGQLVFDAWRNSLTHNTIMLGPNYLSVGIGRSFNEASNYGHYWTANFGGV
jgi:uncharacterized protein YkwD